MKESTYGRDHRRICIAVQLTPPNDHHCNRQKKTSFGVATGGGVGQGIPVLM